MSEPNPADGMPVEERNHTVKEATLNRACDYCRGLKVRCFPDPGSSSSTCQRCARSNRACTYAAPQRRKQRKRTDARVAELEKEMKAMRSLLRLDTVDGNRAMEQAQQTEKNLRYGQDSFPDHIILSQELNDQNTTPNSQVTMDVSPPQIADREERDSVDRGLLTMASATELYNIFINELTPHYPTVTFPSHHTADELRRRRPTLFLAVMAAASGRTDPNLYSVLNAELLQIYASRAVITGEKSLELVQSMIITAVWYYPKDKFYQLKFYQYIHMAATIALDIGLGSKPASSSIKYQGPCNSTTVSSGIAGQSSQDTSPQSTEEESDDAMVDAKRTILVCYLICSGVAISLRRPNMLRFNSWMKQCTSFLENLPTATVFDRRLVARVRLQNIAEEFASLLSLEDPDDTSITLDSRTQLTLKAFERRLRVWKESQDPEVMNASTLMLYYHINILLHEIALRDDHPATDFKPPYFVDRFRPESRVKEKLTAPTIDAIMQCVTFSHDLLDTFMSLDVSTTRALPVYKFVMVCYSILILTKLSQSVENPTSEIGKILDHSSIALDSYTDRAITQFTKATGIEEFRVPSKFLFVLNCIRGFRRGQCFHPTQGIADSDVMRPLLHLTLEEPANSHAHCRPLDARSPAFGSGGYARKSNGPIPPNMHISSHDDATTTYTQIHSVDQNNNSTPNNSEYTFQYAQEQSPAQLTSKSTQVPAPGISYELNMGPSVFSGLPEDESFTEELYNWIPPASVTGHTVDEQMLDLQYWGYDSHPQT